MGFGPSGVASPGRSTLRGADPLEEGVAGAMLGRVEPRTAVGPVGLEGATGGGSPTSNRSGDALGRPVRAGPGAQR